MCSWSDCYIRSRTDEHNLQRLQSWFGRGGKGAVPLLSESAAVQTGACQLSLCLKIGEMSDKNLGAKLGSCNIDLLL
jgi:hypothetical protein